MIRRAFIRALSGAILTTLLGVRPWRLDVEEPRIGWVLEGLFHDGSWREISRGEGDAVPAGATDGLDGNLMLQMGQNLRATGVWL